LCIFKILFVFYIFFLHFLTFQDWKYTINYYSHGCSAVIRCLPGLLFFWGCFNTCAHTFTQIRLITTERDRNNPECDNHATRDSTHNINRTFLYLRHSISPRFVHYLILEVWSNLTKFGIYKYSSWLHFEE